MQGGFLVLDLLLLQLGAWRAASVGGRLVSLQLTHQLLHRHQASRPPLQPQVNSVPVPMEVKAPSGLEHLSLSFPCVQWRFPQSHLPSIAPSN